jgi:hypothetical protein
LSSAFKLVSSFAYFSTLKMEATYSSDKSIDFQRTTHYILEVITIHTHHCDNLKFTSML